MIGSTQGSRTDRSSRGRRGTRTGPHSQGTAGIAPTQDGRRLHYQYKPATHDDHRVPAVVFESGLACGRSYWAAVQRELAGSAPTIVYDRSGLGRSAPDNRPRTLRRLADDLIDVVDYVDERLAPSAMVLVGHSWGGPIVRLAAADRPERIAGLVLLDPTDEGCGDLFTTANRRANRRVQLLSVALARIGALPLVYRSTLAALPDDARHDFRVEGFTRAAMRTRGAELASYTTDLESLRAADPDRPDLPMTIVSAASTSPGISVRSRAALTAAHRSRTDRMPDGRHLVADCGHMVPTERPATVAAEIARIIAATACDIDARGRRAGRPRASAGHADSRTGPIESVSPPA
ncbi:alpha/beta fold hydrolase [Nocardia spumae]|uniref:alpha/beta fold hydrolase n=1 Tax=Nocardia spumae TaxID=2887190 RepID=UPI001D15707C|nr:alpha/beta hydrolase [Nocardia spumae]